MKKSKKAKLKKAIWILIGLAAVVIICFSLLLYKPAYFNHPSGNGDKYISQYVTNVLIPYIHNNAQLSKPFDVTIGQSRTKDFISLAKWPQQYDDITFLRPSAFFAADSLVFTGSAVVKDVEFVVTIVVKPQWNENRLLNLHITTVKIGAVNITAFVKLITRNVYARKLATKEADPEDIGPKLIASLMADKPFEPVFEIRDDKLRIEKITLTQEKLSAVLLPVPK